MISLVTLGVVCLMLIGIVLLRERYWRRRFAIVEREYLDVVAKNRRLSEARDRTIRSAMRYDD